MAAMAFADHLESYFPDSAHEDLASARSAVQRRLPGFRVRRIAPEHPRKPWVYATCGAAPAEEDGAEYVLLAPTQDPVIVEMLAALATVNADADEGLGVGSVIALGRPWVAGSQADHLLVVPPYVFPPGFATYDDGEREVVVLWLVPITAAEARYARRHGHEALEQLIERRKANVAHPGRASLV
jgi:hypothetical protein